MSISTSPLLFAPRLASSSSRALAACAALLLSAAPTLGQSPTPKAEKGCTLSVFAKGVAGQPQVDDTLFTPSSDGFLLVSDTAANLVYKIEKAEFAPGVAYSAGVAGTTAAPGLVGRLDLEFGQLTPIVSGLQSPHGLAFVKTEEDDDSPRELLKDFCEKRLSDR